MDNSYIKIPSPMNSSVQLKVIRGHFATSHSHITCYVDITTMKSRCSEAHNVASLLATRYSFNTPVDTIVCMDGTEVIGTYLADELTKSGILSLNAHKTIYVVSPEYGTNGRILFRDNMQMAIRGKNVLVLLGSVTTGKSLQSITESLEYYQAKISGAAALFSAVESAGDVHVISAFKASDVPDFKSYKHHECPLCKAGVKIDALVNSYGYSVL
uniref:orotate phosphoribosyltransferase n=1 Tax=Eubacterium cellulosolvens TaxID=29322 RepID=UPI00048703D3|nr:orotate phosphoribosyltransferase [[Eubacterium] cellulosolvens]